MRVDGGQGFRPLVLPRIYVIYGPPAGFEPCCYLWDLGLTLITQQSKLPGDLTIRTRSSAISYERPRDALCQLKSCQLSRNSAKTAYTTSPDRIDGMKLEI